MSLSSSSGGLISQAFVEVTADTRDADREIDRFVRGLRRVDDQAELTGEEIEGAFAEAARGANEDLRDIGGQGAFQPLVGRAELAGEDVENAFAEAQRQSDQQLRDIGGAGTFTPATVGAEQAGESIDSSFAEAQRQSDAELRQIGGVGTYTPATVGAESAGESIENSFAEAQRQSDSQLRQIGGPGLFTGVRAQAEVAGEGITGSFREAARQSNTHLASIGLAAGRFGALFAGGLAVAGGALTFFGLQGAASLEQTQIGFTALLGSAEEADAFIRDMQDFAAKTPFEFQGLTDSARQLLAVSDAIGLTRDEIIPTIGVFGDLTSVLGQSADETMPRIVRALGQMGSRGRVTSEEMLQLGESLPGFQPFKAMADGLGLTTAELQEQITAGLIPAEEGIAALIEGMREFPGAAGAMTEQSQTLIGVLSTFKDTITLALTEAFQPLVPTIRDALAEATPLIEDGLAAIAPPISEIAGLLVKNLGTVLAELGPSLGVFLEGLADAFVILGEAGGPVLELIGTLLEEMAPVLVALAGPLSSLITLFANLLTAILPPLSAILVALFDALAPVTDELVSIAETVLTNLAPAMEEIIPIVQQFLQAFGQALLEVLVRIGPQIPQLTESFGDLLVQLALILPELEPLLPVLVDLLVLQLQMATVTLPLLTSAIIGVRIIIGSLTRTLGFLWRNVAEPFADFILGVLGPVFIIVQGIIDRQVRPAVERVTRNFSTWIDTVRRAADTARNNFSPLLDLLRRRLDTVRTAASRARDFIDSLSRIVSTAAGLVGTAARGGFAVFKGILDGINAVARSVARAIDLVRDAARRAAGVVKNFVDSLPGRGVVDDFIPFLQEGGIVTRDTLAQLHAPEVVIPLNRPDRALELARQSGLLDLLARSQAVSRGTGISSPAGRGLGGSLVSTPTVNVTINAPGATRDDADRIASATADATTLALERRRLVFSARTAS